MQGARCNTMQDKKRFGLQITSILIPKMHQDLKNEIMLMDFYHKNIFRTVECFVEGQDLFEDLQESLQNPSP
jgi:hypothetical protein